MSKYNSHKLGDVIKKIISNPKISVKLEELDVLQVWNDLIGSHLSKYIIDQKVKKQVLYVFLNSSVVRNELSYNKSEFVLKINEYFGKKLIKDIVFK